MSISYGRAAPVRSDDGDVVVGEDDAFVGGQFGLDGGAQQTAAGEAGEGALLVEDLAGDERQAEDLAVRMGDRGAGLPPVVDDRLGVADLRRRRVLGESVTQHRISCAAWSSSSRCSPASWSGVYTNTSWMPLASAITWTGPRLWTANASSPSKAG